MSGRLANSPCSFFWLVLALAAAPAVAQHAEAGHSWSYEGEHGPAHWGEVSPEYSVCRTGKHQSPIDIRGATPAGLPPIVFSYAPSPLRIIDNGQSVQVNYATGSFITVGGRRYDLVQFHFHHPSEERMTGQAYPLSVHLVHRDVDGKLAAVAVLLKTGRQNPFIEGLWKDLPADVGQERAPEGATVDLRQLLPANHGYYTFTGSLTTPPCSEDVSWFVLKTPMEISKSEEAVFAKKYANNARLHGLHAGRGARRSRRPLPVVALPERRELAASRRPGQQPQGTRQVPRGPGRVRRRGGLREVGRQAPSHRG